MGDRRKRLGGWQYKKIAEEKLKRQNEAINSTKKIDTFFSAVNKSLAPSIVEALILPPTSTSNDKSNIGNDSCSHNSEESQTSHIENIDSNIENAEECEEGHSIRDEIDEKLNESNTLSSFKFEKDPIKWILNNQLVNYVAENGFFQNMECNFQNSKRNYADQSRYFCSTICTRNFKNGEKGYRHWIIYSESSGNIFCGPCRLFAKDIQFANTGFNDWKNLKSCVEQHERSLAHKNSIVALKMRGSDKTNLPGLFGKEIDQEVRYWSEVLKRVVAVVKKLTSRGLPIRGSQEILGSNRNGNFLMAIELLAEFDPFLNEHLKKCSNPGSGKTNCLSSTIYEEFVTIMGQKTREVIISNIKTAKYFSIIVDSTPDVSHIYQLSIVIRYVQNCGTPTEKFLTFIPNAGHKAEEMTKVVIDILIKYEINLNDCRGQSYDNASNMSGIYSGLQARIKNKNKFAKYSLNLVGTCGANCCLEATSYFMLLQELFNFFSASTKRWKKLQSGLSSANMTPKSLSCTRWSSRDDACKSLLTSWHEIKKVLDIIENDYTEKNTTRAEAKGITRKLSTFETAFMTVFWNAILNRINAVSKKLQSQDVDIALVNDLYKALISFVSSIRNDFEIYEEKAKTLSNSSFSAESGRQKKRKRPFDETRNSEEVNWNARDDFRIGTYINITDHLSTELERRLKAYSNIYDIFKVLLQIRTLNTEEINRNASLLHQNYPDDIEDDFIDECLYLKQYLLQDRNKDVSINNMCSWIRKHDLVDIFPNVDKALRIFKTLAVTNCSSERSFSCLKRIKNYMRSTMCDSRLNDFAILSIESDIVNSISFDSIIKDFAEKKSRKVL